MHSVRSTGFSTYLTRLLVLNICIIFFIACSGYKLGPEELYGVWEQQLSDETVNDLADKFIKHTSKDEIKLQLRALMKKNSIQVNFNKKGDIEIYQRNVLASNSLTLKLKGKFSLSGKLIKIADSKSNSPIVWKIKSIDQYYLKVQRGNTSIVTILKRIASPEL